MAWADDQQRQKRVNVLMAHIKNAADDDGMVWVPLSIRQKIAESMLDDPRIEVQVD